MRLDRRYFFQTAKLLILIFFNILFKCVHYDDGDSLIKGRIVVCFFPADTVGINESFLSVLHLKRK